MRVLLVEDDEMIGQSLRDALDANGWSVDWVKDGLLAQSALEDGDYACVLLDLGLPKRDALLHALLERPGAILSRDQLENRIYGWGEEVSSNAVDVLIHGMRRKLGADTIRNVRGLGYMLETSSA